MHCSNNLFHDSGCLILAGGQGSRMGCQGPKGCLNLSVKDKKTLFQILFEKIQVPTASIAVMTSPLNHQATVNYLEENRFFGLHNVTLFQQELDGRFPNGNGKAFAHFVQLGIWEQWKREGIEYLQVIPIDNPLAIPFDEQLLQANREFELVIRGVKRRGSEEKIGVILEERSLKIIEYTESSHLSEDLLGNTGIFSCTMDFVRRVSSLSLPIHTVQKKSGEKWVVKKEYFIFDLFPYAITFKVLLSDRKKYFAPIKNRAGPDSYEQWEGRIA